MSVSTQLFGVPRLLRSGDSLKLPAGKTTAILCYFAYKADWVTRDELVYLFWPESDELAAKRNLRQVLLNMRRLPYLGGLEISDWSVRWLVRSDAHDFRSACERSEHLQALSIYTGQFLQGLKTEEWPEVDEWRLQEQAYLTALFRDQALALANELRRTDRSVEGAEVLARLDEFDAMDQNALRMFLEMLHETNQLSRLDAVFQMFEQKLAEYGAVPDEETQQLYKQLQVKPVPPKRVRSQNLPAPANTFIGRYKDLEQIRRLLAEPNCQILTLHGPGGIGKTRLALEVARKVATSEMFADGVWLVELASVTTADGIVTTIAESVKFSFYGDTNPEKQLTTYLRDRRMLLLIDNCEQLINAAPLLARILAECPTLKMLCTSREVLGVYGEHEYPVPPLTLPDPQDLPPFQELSQYEAVAIFIQQAQTVKADFEVNNDNAPAVAEICWRLDGLPLAIELAAARIRLFTPQVLLARLTNRLQILTSGARSRPQRQQTLRNTILWSYDLLSADEQTLFKRLAVFSGVRSLEAIEAVCNPERKFDILTTVDSLVKKSLLRWDVGLSGEPKFLMLETIHEFAAEMLGESAEAETLKMRHAHYFLQFAETAEHQLKGPNQERWLDRLDKEQGNFRTALSFVVRAKETETFARFLAALWMFYLLRSYQVEARAYMNTFLGATSPGVATTPCPGIEPSGNLFCTAR